MQLAWSKASLREVSAQSADGRNSLLLLDDALAGHFLRHGQTDVGQIVGDAQLSDLEEQGQTLMDYVKSSYHYQSDRVSRALSDLTGKEDADA